MAPLFVPSVRLSRAYLQGAQGIFWLYPLSIAQKQWLHGGDSRKFQCIMFECGRLIGIHWSLGFAGILLAAIISVVMYIFNFKD